MSAEPWEFFFEHAGYSYDPARESRTDGRERCARELAAAEVWGVQMAYTFEWEIDQETDSSEWTDERPSWCTWNCIMRDQAGNVLASLCAIDFGRDGDPWGQPYARVVQAELADEARSEYFKDRSLPV